MPGQVTQRSRVGDPKLTKEQVPDRTYSNWALTGSLSWEIDLFGRLPHHVFPGGPTFRTPALVLAMLWFRLRDLF